MRLICEGADAPRPEETVIGGDLGVSKLSAATTDHSGASLRCSARRRVRDLRRKATCQVAEAFANATCYVGEPFNDAALRIGRVQAQHVSAACTRKIITQLDYKTAGAITLDDPYSSQTCMRGAEQTAQDVSLPIVRSSWLA
jgi:hypothetical protein